MKQKEWSKDQKLKTKRIIDELDVIAFCFDLSGKNKGCNLDHIDGSYGYIKLMDAANYKYPIYDYETDELLATYESLDDLVNNGWKVST
ncbi:MAG: hypothetical protein ACPKM0_12345 [Pleomorphochaeta sp.]